MNLKKSKKFGKIKFSKEKGKYYIIYKFEQAG